jgi:hypothetical protein
MLGVIHVCKTKESIARTYTKYDELKYVEIECVYLNTQQNGIMAIDVLPAATQNSL